ncbi:16S rRNA (guanine(966)-N(2))-methyltransferase RsmD [Colwellia sp. 1_MG-2023]|jgi:16S rRNA (guanine966-N2)-methyltransferase|nr:MULTISPECIES: 16S rRNA (guanine(966)-N(2))-methyltransferase RsmD [unclassified Colwellia]MDO6486152.1 16S rRNA (guanine(966)-N(2))-methyltransferase RsmD [Colwellia sp. 6_MG-2023]MDO6653235.1 16S rRNA (guanine(966)-N(2))-methyltransferase RsmD [Colwellia sp. 3_MG-2023]MDO6664520.1 16S rRNA (guanine(966)-N(2))-methyltransferase RsmD [Colwellia sp. 2_MG-2023]MDO6688871.1 16S rRNA (guanine(966)-N(2))-methyltransferase RsmD [Colwellia sp. 1_MG-2023]
MITVSDMSQGKKQQKKKAASGSIRIIAGKHKGRKLPVLAAEGLRPTADRVKETLFNWLMPYIHGANCLDCFAGAGSLGFEALSRGAANVHLMELNKAAAKQLSANKQLLKSDDIVVSNTDTLAFLKTQTPVKFDVVFIDPPFRQNLISQTCELLNQGWLSEQALIYVEMEAESDQALPSNWQLLKEKIAGQVAYRLYQNS